MKIFKESQRFDQWWLLLFGLVVILIMVFSFVGEYKDAGNHLSDELLNSMLISGGLVLAVSFLIILIRLKTEIDEKGISYQFTPFHIKRRLIPWSDLSKCYIRQHKRSRNQEG